MNTSTMNAAITQQDTNRSNSFHPQPRHLLLALSLAFLAIGFSASGINIYCYLGLPIGTILFGLFLIATVLHKEMAAHVQEQRKNEVAPASVRPQTRMASPVRLQVSR